MPSNPPTLSLPTPSLGRRLTVLVYEAFLVAAVLLGATALFMLVTFNSHHPLVDHARKLWLFAVIGAYFVFCWIDSGHTLAMKTWRIKLVGADGGKVALRTAVLRYLLAWGWFAPAIVVSYLFHLTNDKAAFSIALLAGMALWAMTVFTNRERQFLHDHLLGTRLVLLPKLGAQAPAQVSAP